MDFLTIFKASLVILWVPLTVGLIFFFFGGVLCSMTFLIESFKSFKEVLKK